MEIEKYRTIETTLDLANDYTPPIRLNAGDIDKRILKFHITDGAGNAKAFTLADSDSTRVCSPPFNVHLNGLKSVS